VSTNVPPITYTASGYVAPEETAVLAGVQADIQAAFAPVLPTGVTMNFTTSNGSQTNPTPQGELAESQTAIIAATYDALILYSNLVDPAFTYGRMQDAIGRIYYVSRNPGQATVATCTCIGAVNVIIPAGSTLQDDNGVVCTALSGGKIGAGGNVQINFQADTPGPTTLAPPLTIISSVPGWDTVTLTSQVLGSLQESSQAYETRRSQSTAKNAAGCLSNIRGAVLSVASVLDCRVIANSSNTPQNSLPSGQPIGITLAPNSIYAIVEGGDATSIAQAIFSRWMPGAPTNGSQSISITDTGSSLALPYPTYTINFDYAAQLPFVINVQVSNINVPAGAAVLIQNAVAAAFVGQDVVGYNAQGAPVYGPRAGIGALLIASRFYPTVVQVLWPGASLVSIKVGSTNAPVGIFTGSITSSVLTVTAVASGALAVGQNLFDNTGDLASGIQVLSQLSGTPGGVGTYSVTTTPDITSETMLAVTATYDEVLPNVNQLPTILAANVNVIFTNPGTS